MGREGNNFAREAEIQSAAALVVPRSCLPISRVESRPSLLFVSTRFLNADLIAPEPFWMLEIARKEKM